MKNLFLLISLFWIFFNASAQDKYFNQLFYVDFYPTLAEDSLFRGLDSSILRMTKPLTFFRENAPLTQTEFKQIRKELKNSPKILADTNTAYRIYFVAFNGFTNFSIFGFGKNYDNYTYINGPDTSIKIGIEPAFYLRLIDYQSIFPSETTLLLKRTLIDCFKRSFPIYRSPKNPEKLIPFVDSPLDSNTMVILDSYFSAISKKYLRDYNKLEFYLDPTDSSRLASNDQIESITSIAYKEILNDEEHGEIEHSYNSPILPSEILFSLKFKEIPIQENKKEDYHCLWIGIELDFIGLNYIKDTTENTLWRKNSDISNEHENHIIKNIFEMYYYRSIWRQISEKRIDISKQISNILKANNRK